jgi:hypothetical protein
MPRCAFNYFQQQKGKEKDIYRFQPKVQEGFDPFGSDLN